EAAAPGSAAYLHQVVNKVRADPALPPNLKMDFYTFAVHAEPKTGIIVGLTARGYARELGQSVRTVHTKWNTLRKRGLARREHHYRTDTRDPNRPDDRANSWILCYPGIEWPGAGNALPSRGREAPAFDVRASAGP